MTSLFRIGKLLACFAITAAGMLFAFSLEPESGWPGWEKTAYAAAGGIPGMIAFILLRGDTKANIKWLLRPVPWTTWLWRALGCAICLCGMFLGLGNISGRFPTFPYAGTLVMFAGAILVASKGDGPAA